VRKSTVDRVVSRLDNASTETQFLHVGSRAVSLLPRLRAAGRGAECHRLIDALSKACLRLGASPA
jgi:hypothetical protein